MEPSSSSMPFVERLDISRLDSPSPVQYRQPPSCKHNSSSSSGTLVESDVISLTTSTRSAVSNASVGQMLTEATREDGTIDYAQLKHIIREEQMNIKLKYKQERARRKMLEDMVVRLSQPVVPPRPAEHNPYANVVVSAQSPRPTIHKPIVLPPKEKEEATRPVGNEEEENYYKSTSLFDSGRSTAARRFAVEEEGWWWIDARLSASQRSSSSVEQVVKDKLFNSFTQRSEARQQLVRDASAGRRAWAAEQRHIAQSLLTGHMTPEDADQLLARLYARPLPAAFPKKDMVMNTKSRYAKLPETIARRREEERELEMATNRLCAQIYKQRLTVHAGRWKGGYK